MKIIINIDEANMNITTEDAEGVRLDDVIAAGMVMMEQAVQEVIQNYATDGDGEEYLYDMMSALFDKFLVKVFPNVAPEPIGLSDAALLYAEDLLIENIDKKGKTYDEAMKEFEEKAQKYLKTKGSRLA